ncbi:MAG: undecaprenyl-diphosphate phosphatase [Deltaproteobacteria bacterium]|nr:undecaprenyl-diphosphate phosphatase [Deltaproteobacteria bacterium]
MASTFFAILLGAVQGLTEFLPVSSSGHLVIAQHLLGMKEPDLLLDTTLHVGTTLAALVFLRPQIVEILAGLRRLVTREAPAMELWRTDRGVRWMVLVVCASIPTGLAGVFLKDFFEQLFGSVLAVGIALCTTAVILFATHPFLSRPAQGGKPLTIPKAFFIGVMQAMAITPGISRSGATIAAGVFVGVEVENVARFQFPDLHPGDFGRDASPSDGSRAVHFIHADGSRGGIYRVRRVGLSRAAIVV